MSAPAATARASQRNISAYLYPRMPTGGLRGWLGPIAVTALAALLRIPNLGRPNDLVFDETYYAKDALGLLRFGTEQETVDGANELILGSNGNPSSTDIFTGDPSYVVHPPLGKWIIAAGEATVGVTPTGWRIGMLVVGLLAVLAFTRIARRLFRSNLWGTVAGFLLAIDGLAIVMSRTALLDNALMLFVLLAFGALLLDRDAVRRRLGMTLPSGWYPGDGWSPSWPGIRPWRLAAALSLGAACSVKWSGLWFVLAFGLLSVVWDLNLRRTLGVEQPWRRTLIAAIPTAVVWITVVGVVYVLSWSGWLLTDDGYLRQWAQGQSSAFGFVPDALRSLWHYHAEAWRFHTSLTSEHSYAANAFAWPIQGRPTAFFYDGEIECAGQKCSQEVLALGNPLIWWAGAVAVLHQVWRAIARRDWISSAIVVGYAAGWAPWLLYQDRPIFAFYAIVLLPFMLLALTYSAKILLAASGWPRSNQRAVVLAGLALALLVSWFFYPVWVGEPIPYEQWQMRMWLPSWV